MSDDPRWKAALLSSGLPLQHETARLLVSKGFAVDADFQVARVDSGAAAPLSVDLRATAMVAPAGPRRATGAIELVVECRHARPDVGWLFLPDVNPPDAAAVGRSIRVVDEFSLSRVDAGATAAFDAELPVCCKGVEVDPVEGRVDDAEPGRGLMQLQSALPRLMVESILRRFRNRSGESEKLPFLFCPVLLTTAPLWVARPDFGAEHAEQATDLRDLAVEAPYLAVVRDFGPDFQSHCRWQFRALEALERNEELLMIETRHASTGRDATELPIASIESLIAADADRLRRLFSRFLVCTKSHLPELIEKIQQTAEAALESRQELR